MSAATLNLPATASQLDGDNLSADEKQELAQHEGTIEKGMKTVFDVASAMAGIREKRLYRETHKTFELYCDQRWGFSKTHANRMIAGASVLEDLTPIGVKPKNLEQTKPLARLNPDQRREAWRIAEQRAAGKELTAFQLEQAALQVAPKVPRRRIRLTKEETAKAKRTRERRSRRVQRMWEEARKRQREEWEQKIRATWSHAESCSGLKSEFVESDIDDAVARAFELGPSIGDVAFFQGARFLAVVIFKDDGSPVFWRRADMEGGVNG